MAANAKECEDRNRVLKEEREIMLAHFQELKGQMNKLREAARAELLILTLQSNAAISELKRVSTKVGVLTTFNKSLNLFIFIILIIIFYIVFILIPVFIMQGERILKLAEMCRKLETEEEKVLPFYASSLTEQEQVDVSAVVQEPPTQPLAEVIYFRLLYFIHRHPT